jgi:galactose oxidase-like protein
VALGCALWLALVPAAPAHLGHEQARAGAADPAEAARPGTAHARAHAMARAMDEARQQPMARRTPAQRRQRQAQSRRETQAFNARLAGQRDDAGYWDPTLYPLPEYAINSIVLPTNKILIFGREPTGADGTRSNLGSARLYDPLTGATRHVPPPPIPENDGMPAPIFCAGQTTLSDGRILIAGGNLSDPVLPDRPDFSGLDYTFIFDPWNEADPWELGPRMTNGRWYPTLTRLSSGDVLIASGLDEDGRATRNGRLDVWRPGESASVPLAPYPAGERNDPRETTTPNLDPDAQWGMSLYPYLHTLPDGNVALAGPGHQDSAILDTAAALDRGGAPGSAWTQIMKFGQFPGQLEEGTTPSRPHQGGMGLMEPETQGFQGSWNLIAMAGSDDPVPGEYKPARPVVDRFDARPGVRRWTRDADLNQARLYANSVLLPDGGIAVVGGGLGAWGTPPGLWYVGENEPGGPPPQLKQVELRQPGERTWRLGAAQREFRAYHSTAVLLPDGRIVSAGDDGRAKLTASRDNAEIYWPPNLFDGDACALRPVIRGVGAPGGPPAGARQWATLTYGEQLGIFSEHAGRGMQAVLVAPAATTHSFDMNQRLVPLAVNARVAGGGLNVTMPATPAIAPPGYYMLFVVGEDGTPSEARWVHVLPPAAAAAERGGVTPATVGGDWPNPEGRRCVNPDGTQRSEPYTRPPGDEAPAPAGPSSPGTGGSSRPAKQPAKLALTRATIHRAKRQLDVLAPISALASGRVGVELRAAGHSTRLSSPVDARKRRVRVLRPIPAAQARLGTGILTLRYRGNDATLPQTVRLRAAARPARLMARRPALDAQGRLRASGTISPRARGVVRVELQFAAAGGARTLSFRAKIRSGRWTLRTQLTRANRAAIAGRTGTVHASTLFTGYAPLRMRGEMRSHQVLGAP